MTNFKTVAKVSLFLNKLLPQRRIVYEMVILWYELNWGGLHILNILNDFDRSPLTQEVAIAIPAARLIQILEEVIWTAGKPKNTRCGNGPRFIAGIFQEWCKANDINLMYIQSSHPTQNSYRETQRLLPPCGAGCIYVPDSG